jgi:hypothetical protein
MDINITNPVTASKIGEVVNGASAATPNDTDLVPIVESSVTKKLTLTNLKAFLKTYFDTLYSALTASSFGTFINGLTGKTTPVDADEIVISDSAASNVAKKVTGTNFKAYLKTYFDTLYQAVGTYLTSANITQTITNGVTDKAPSEDAVFDALALKQDKVSGVDDTEIGYLNGVTSAIQTQLDKKHLFFQWQSFNPAASTIYHIGGAPSTPFTANTFHRTFARSTFTATTAAICVRISGTPSNHNATFELQENASTLQTITTSFDWSTVSGSVINLKVTGLSLSINSANTYNVKLTMGANTTVPTAVFGTIELY